MTLQREEATREDRSVKFFFFFPSSGILGSQPQRAFANERGGPGLIADADVDATTIQPCMHAPFPQARSLESLKSTQLSLAEVAGGRFSLLASSSFGLARMTTSLIY